jgi:ATP-dependent helicase HrpB
MRMPQLPPLPIDEVLPAVHEALAGGGGAVLVAPPGAGKSTRVAPALLGAPWLARPNDRLLMLQPRRVAARSVAARIASEQRVPLGGLVGYQVRFDNVTSAATRLTVITEGILTRRIQSDPFLEGVGCVILDEFHERSIHTDLALALCREIQQTVREDLRVLVMSATMDPKPVAQFLGGAPIIRSEGRLHPVEVEFLARPSDAPCWELAASAVRQSLSSPGGHVLVFLPGMREIRRTYERLGDVDAELHQLHSSVPPTDQDRALAPSTRRKVILATNIAETSITIDGVDTVIDSGLVRMALHDPRLGIDRLDLRRISRASADQRAGRAGRTGPGRCLRLWSRQEDPALPPADLPEIHRVDLAQTLLALHRYGVREAGTFGWFDKPRPDALSRAAALLRLLGAVAEDGRLTPLGEQLAAIPLHPRLARLLLAGAEHGLAREAATIAAALSDGASPERSDASRAPSWAGESDLLDILDDDLSGPAQRNVRRLRDELLGMVRGTAAPARPPADTHRALMRLPLYAYPDRVCLRRANDSARGVMVGGRGVVLDAASCVRTGQLFLALDPRDPDGGGGEARVRMASAIDAEMLKEAVPHLLREVVVHRYDPERGRVLSARQTVYIDISIAEAPLAAASDPEGVAAALAEGLRPALPALLAADESLARWVARVRFVHHHCPEAGAPALDEDSLATALRAACLGVRSAAEVGAGRLRSALEEMIPWAARARLAELAPEAIEVPSGSKIRLAYDDDPSRPPVLAVRLQELFGLADTPRVAAGRVAVLLHLLGPNYRPVQVTQDLRNFWNTTYAEVRKELRARYPRHPWPDDPWNAPPVAVGRRRRPSG